MSLLPVGGEGQDEGGSLFSMSFDWLAPLRNPLLNEERGPTLRTVLCYRMETPMTVQLDSIDPQWAWSEYSPAADSPWNRRRAAHLFRRAGFGAGTGELNDAVRMAPLDVVASLFAANQASADFDRRSNDFAQTVLASGKSTSLASWWLYRMLDTPNPLLEKMTLFWHGHFATSADKVRDAALMYQQNQLLRQYALGDFAELVQQISRDPAMLIYLDSVTNRKAHPNENYAREVMELFCLGEGNYSEKDVQEVARCFTGWEIRRDKFHFNRYQHDNEPKTILGQTGEFGGEDAVRIILQQPAAAEFIVRKLIRFFLFDEPDAPADLVQPLAATYRAENYDSGRLVKRILSSQLFFSDLCIGRKIRSPIEFAVGLLRTLESKTDVVQLHETLSQQGHSLFHPPSVKGWEGGRTWINSSTLLGRANGVRMLVDSGKSRFAKGQLAELAHQYGIDTPAKMVDWLLEVLVAVPVPNEIRRQLVQIAAQGHDPSRQIGETIYAVATLPEFQLA